MKKVVGTIFGVLIFLGAMFYFFDFGFLKGEITEYSLSCDKKNYINYNCTERWLPLNPTTYKPNVSKQQVLYWTFSEIQTLNKCSVVDRKNWTCKYNDESAEFGFKDGQFWEVSLGKNIYGTESITDELFEYRHVPKYIYRIEEMKWW